MPSLFISDRYCKGCGLCVAMCPTKALATSKQMNSKGYFLPRARDMRVCTLCHQCTLICPDFAIAVIGGGEKHPQGRK